MNLLIILAVVTTLVFFIELSDAKNDYNKARNLNINYENWLKDSDNNKPPSNAIFEDLFERKYGFSNSTKEIYRGNRAVLITEKANLVQSFPNKHRQLIPDYLKILDNLEEHYAYIYEEKKTLKYWLKTIFKLPQRFIEYLNPNADSRLINWSNIIYWIGSVLWAVFETQIINYISTLLP